MEPPQAIPRSREDDHAPEIVARRHALAVKLAGRDLPHLSGVPVPPGAARGNIENLLGYVQVPVGLAGPLVLDTSVGERTAYVPMATTEGAMVASYGRGMKALNLSGGTRARVQRESLSQHPVLLYPDAAATRLAAAYVRANVPALVALVAEITRHGALVEVTPEPVGRRLVLRLGFTTQDAIGINMAAQGAERCAAFVARETGAEGHYVHGEDVEKRAHHAGFLRGRGRSVCAEAVLSRDVLERVLRVTPEELVAIQRTYAFGFARLGTTNHLVQAANGIAAVYLACGQDVAYVTESASGLLDFEVRPDGDLYASAFLPSLLVGTVGGGSGQGTAAECLALLGVAGAGGANTFAEILAATVLAGDLSLLASFCTHEFVAAHERLGRNRPADPGRGGR